MDEEKKKALTNRTISRKSFNALTKQINKAIKNKNPIESIEETFNELKLAKQDLKQQHASYLACTLEINDEDIDDSADDKYLDQIEDDFSLVKQSIHDHRQALTIEKDKKAEDGRAVSHAAEKATATAHLRSRRETETALFNADCKRVEDLQRNKENLSSSVVNSLCQALESKLSKLTEINEQLICQLDQEKTKVEIEWLLTIQSQCRNATESLNRLKDSITKSSPSVCSGTSSSDLQLNKLPMPSFSGKIRDYPRFKKDFMKIVMPRIGSGDPSYALMSCLKDEPKSIVTCISDDASAMWKRLDEVYGDPSKIVDAIMRELQEVGIIHEFDHKGLVLFIDMVEGANADLTRLNMEKEINNAHSVSVIESKLPRDARLTWAKYLNDVKDDNKMSNKFPHLLKYLQDQRRIIEYADSSIRCTFDGEGGSISHFGNLKDSAHKHCIIHNANSHMTSECRSYLALSVKDKVETIKKKNACYNCLKNDHLVANCPDAVTCTVTQCGKRHHSSIHDAHKDGIILSLQLKRSSVLLQLMRVTCASPKPSMVTILWDSAAEFCLITFQKAGELGLIGEPKRLSVEKVGGDVELIASFK